MSFSLFSNEYLKLFEKNYISFCRNIKKIGNNHYINKKYNLFFPSCGSSIKNDIQFLIYGQAPNGKWTPQFSVNKQIQKNLISEAENFSNTTNEGEVCPLDWVNKNWSNRKKGFHLSSSFFWNVTYKLINKRINNNVNDEKWCKHLVWSNLMKISNAVGGNPDNIEWTAQLECSKQLFKKEIEEIEPEYAILLTNWSWAENFLKRDSFNIKKVNNRPFVEAYGKFGKTTIIVTKRPFRGSNNKCVTDILELIK